MATLPSLSDFTDAGVTTEDFIARLTEYIGQRTSSLWVVRWNGRIRTIRGICFFHSRESAHNEVVKWLRESGRWAYARPHHAASRLTRNWGYKKSYRTFMDQLVDFLEETGRIEYIELQAPAPGVTRPSDTSQALIG